MNKKVIIGVVVVILIVLVWWLMAAKPAAVPVTGTTAATQSVGGTASAYDQDLKGLDDSGLNNEMKTLDAGINKL